MTDQRWTIRGVPCEAVEAIRSLSHETGESAGSLVGQAIMAWVDSTATQPLPEAPQEDEFAAILATARARLEMRQILIDRLFGNRR